MEYRQTNFIFYNLWFVISWVCNVKTDFKACVRYFHQIFIFSANDSLSKTMKNAFYFIQKTLRSWDIQFFVFLFLNLKVNDVINCLNKNSITHFVWYPEKEKRYDIETLSIDGVSDNEHFYRKIMQKMCSKS